MTLRNAPLAWAVELFPGETEISAKTIANHPWACTQKMTVGSKIYYLKEVRCKGVQFSGFISSLGTIAQSHVPILVNHDLRQNFYLYSDFDAKVFEDHLPADDKRAALRIYANIQARSLDCDEFANELEHTSCRGAFSQFMNLLNDAAETESTSVYPGNPFSYFSGKSITEYITIFEELRIRLDLYLAAADAAPRVINHGDLRPKNIAKKTTGEIIIFDWDDAVWAPPGLSLHAQFSGCSRIIQALDRSDRLSTGDNVENRSILADYIGALSQHRAFGDTELDAVLIGASIAGVFHYINGFAPYAVSSKSSIASIKRNARRRISDLLSGLEHLAKSDDTLRRQLRSGYLATGRKERAQTLVSPKQAERQAEAKSYPLPKGAPYDIHGMGRSTAAASDVDRATQAYINHGCLILRDVIDARFIEACKSEFFGKLDDHNETIERGEALRVGDKRYMLSPELEGSFCRPEVLAPKPLMQVLDNLLGPGFVLGSFTAVASSPGAAEQKIHRDNPLLFPERGHMEVPSFCIAVIVPLIDVNALTGTTRLWPRSHRKSSRHLDKVTPVDPFINIGSCYLMDSGVYHQGLANISQESRPILSLVYQRPWYRDHKNFNYQNAVNLSQKTKDRLHPDVSKLVSWVNPS